MNKAAGGPVKSPHPMTKDNSLFVVKQLKFCAVFANALIGSDFCGGPLTRHDMDLHHSDPLCDVFAKQPGEGTA